jgi:sterol desaturase/sphingolipid hydroxylase (fatty acid hydroxylase superfamily)
METVNLLKILLVWGALALFMLLERVWAYGPVRPWRHDIKNLGFAAFVALVSKAWIVPVTLAATQVNWGWLPPGPVWIQWGVWLVVLDAWLYLWHRLNHQIPFLWRFHSIHHLDSALDATTALRFHFGELVFSALFRVVPVVLLNMPLEVVLVYEGITMVSAIFHHSNLRLPAGVEVWLSRVWITPALHWIHHHALQQDTDSNYGVTLTLWDRLFGSYNKAARTPEMPQGVQGEKGDLSFWQLLKRPF